MVTKLQQLKTVLVLFKTTLIAVKGIFRFVCGLDAVFF